MNLVLFRAEECLRPLPATDRRARHIREILGRKVGDAFDCGLVNGPRGKARVKADAAEGLELEFSWMDEPPPLPPVSLMIGMPRPQTVRKILSEVTALGAAHMIFFNAEKGERSYADSSLWSSGELDRLIVQGAEQAFCTRLPEVRRVDSLAAALRESRDQPTRVALDNYEATVALSESAITDSPVCLVVGPERGWSARERDLLRDSNFTLAHLGERVLRTETACIAGLAIVLSRLKVW